MTAFFTTLTVIFMFLAFGAIEDCGGACAGQENWGLFWAFFIAGIMSLITIVVTAKTE